MVSHSWEKLNFKTPFSNYPSPKWCIVERQTGVIILSPCHLKPAAKPNDVRQITGIVGPSSSKSQMDEWIQQTVVLSKVKIPSVCYHIHLSPDILEGDPSCKQSSKVKNKALYSSSSSPPSQKCTLPPIFWLYQKSRFPKSIGEAWGGCPLQNVNC